MLFLVATPIGNIEDITLRAIRIFKECDLVLVEDTRRTSKLFEKYSIKNRMESYNEANEQKKTPWIIELLKQGKKIALATDSGTPGISDPGFYIVRECLNNNIKVTSIPGPSALTSALICSGLPSDRFSFYGFLPKKEQKKEELLLKAKNRVGTKIFYESPYRLVKTLELLSQILPDTRIVVARELTKKFEEFIRGTSKEVFEKMKDRKIKGEIVLLIE